ncbi:MAG: ferritin-like domain-containing protein [Planctomycetota bacterium]|jgi:rubrerythrin
MPITFNADEIFEMAVEIEQNGAKFYREAAQKSTEENIKKMLLDMAAMEDGHIKTFQAMRKELTEKEKVETAFDPYDEGALYLQAMADSHGTEGRVSLTQKLTGQETIQEILEIALNAEKDSVVFYYGLKGYVSAKAGKDKVEAVIMEELTHIRILLDKLNALRD